MTVRKLITGMISLACLLGSMAIYYHLYQSVLIPTDCSSGANPPEAGKFISPPESDAKLPLLRLTSLCYGAKE